MHAHTDELVDVENIFHMYFDYSFFYDKTFKS